MATKMAEIPSRIVVGKETHVRPVARDAFARPIAFALAAAGLIFILGSIADVLILWLFQRQPLPQWEFTALATTTEGLPRIALGAALVYAALHVRGSTSLPGYRLLGLLLVLIGLIGAMLGGLMVLNYFTLRSTVQPGAGGLFLGTVAKTLLLCGLYVVLLIPAGILSMRRPKTN